MTKKKRVRPKDKIEIGGVTVLCPASLRETVERAVGLGTLIGSLVESLTGGGVRAGIEVSPAGKARVGISVGKDEIEEIPDESAIALHPAPKHLPARPAARKSSKRARARGPRASK